MQKLIIFLTEASRIRQCEDSGNPIEIAPTFAEAEVYGQDWAHIYKTDIVMLLDLETSECEHCGLTIQEKPGWIVTKWTHVGTGAYLCWSNALTKATPKKEESPVQYRLLVIDNDVYGNRINDREYVFPTQSEEWVAATAGAAWIARYPQDIAMIVEVEEVPDA